MKPITNPRETSLTTIKIMSTKFAHMILQYKVNSSEKSTQFILKAHYSKESDTGF